MKKIQRWLIVAVLLGSSSILAAERPDGYTWGGWSPSFKLGYIVGYMQGMGFAGTVSMGACMMTIPYLDPAKVPPDKWKEICLSDKTYDFDGISMGQFVDGTDSFYRDYRNKNLEVGFALQYVRDRMRGMTQQDLDTEVSKWQALTQQKPHP